MNDYLPKPGERIPRSAEFVETCNRLLDVGCGTGLIKDFVKHKVKSIFGVDNSLKDLKKAKARGIRTKYSDLDISKLPFKANYFDTVTCLDVIEHVRNPKFLLKQIRRVLKSGGTLIITTPNIRFSDHLFKLIFEGKFPKTSLDSSLYDGGHIHFFTYADLIELLQDENFTILTIDGVINKIHRGWKGLIFKAILGNKFMLEFRTPCILIVAKKT